MNWTNRLDLNSFKAREQNAGVVESERRAENDHDAVAFSIATQLRTAAAAFDARRDGFAQGKGETCRDIAAKLERFGSFASDKQRDFAMKLIEWSKPRGAAPAAPAQARMELPALFNVMQRHAHFYAGALKLSRKNGDSLVWIVFNGVCVGKIENAAVTLFASRLKGGEQNAVIGTLQAFEADPLATAQRYGRESGVCCSCGRDLTDPASIDAGIGPICAQKFA
jgi:hypothetical protein